MKIVGVIPARFASTRFPGKPLAKVAKKPLLQWVIEGAQQSRKLSEIIVATDHQEIADLAQACGVKAIMTDSHLPSGSDRVWAAVEDVACDIVVNIQGDEPLLQGAMLDILVSPFIESPSLQMSTLARPINDEGDIHSLTTAKVVLNKRDEAIYFSRFSIPYSRIDTSHFSRVCYKHIGLYAYRKDFLRQFCDCGPVELEMAESLEQLRALYLGAKIRVLIVDDDSWGVDTPEDVHKIEQMIRKGHPRGKF